MSSFYGWMENIGSSAIALDEFSFSMDEDRKVYRPHPDGSPCYAKNEKDCPIICHNKSAEEADNVGGESKSPSTPFMDSLNSIKEQLVGLYKKGTEQRNHALGYVEKLARKYGEPFGDGIRRMWENTRYAGTAGIAAKPNIDDYQGRSAIQVYHALDAKDKWGIKQFKASLNNINKKMNNLVAEAQSKCPWTEENGYNEDVYLAFIDSVKKEALGSKEGN